MPRESKPFEIQGHRGCRGLMPENTLPAFLRALELGVDTLELDVVVSKDRKVVVSHEPCFHPDFSIRPDGTFVQTSDETNIFQMNYEEIRQFNVGLRQNPRFSEQATISAFKPLLSEVLIVIDQYCKDNRKSHIGLNIEIKSLETEYKLRQPAPQDFVELVYSELAQSDLSANITLQSFDFNVLKYLSSTRSNSREFQISVLIEPEDNNEIDINLEKLGFKPDIWSPNFSILTETMVSLLQNQGIIVIPWTVNEATDMARMQAIGCDGIITDYPDRALKFIKKQV
ncbi:MAG TPA: glycerophosphodiester phosphodiesterase family protein [Leadbetterella sp.]|nr:glycerophosphodiester phosphodiesterase family protein [Leadbetterella sp.]